MNHFEFTGETKVFLGITLKRIKASVSFSTVIKGQIGGWIEKEENLSGNAWVSGNAQVYGDAQVYGNTWVFGNAQVYGDAWVCGDARVCDNARVYGDLEGDPVVLEECDKSYEQIKMPIIADQVNEDWLEKKVLCIVRKHGCNASFGVDDIKFIREEGKCYNADCKFCYNDKEFGIFLEECKKCYRCNEKTSYSLIKCGNHKLCRICYSDISGTYHDFNGETQKIDEQFLQDHLGKKPEDAHQEQPREKVTVDAVNKMFQSVIGSNDQRKIDKLQETIRYLVSLQGE